MTRPNWHPLPTFSAKAPHVFEHEGGYVPPPIPPGFVPPPVVPPQQIAQSMRAVRGPWNSEQFWGQQFNGRLPDEGELIPLLETPVLPGEPGVMTVNFFRSNRGVATEADPTRNAELRCVVLYATGGIQNAVELDMISGVQFSVTASKLTLQLRTYNPAPDSSYAPYDLIAAALIGMGGAGNPLPPTFTTPFILSDAGALGFTVDVPDFARSLCFHTTTTVAAELAKLDISFVTPAVAIKTINVGRSYAELTREKGIAIPNGCNQISVNTNAVLVDPIRAGLQFFLAL